MQTTIATQTHKADADWYRIALFAERGEKLFVLSEKGQFRLPLLSAPRHQRIAEKLTAALKSRWSQEAVCLFPVDSSSHASEIRCQVMQSCGDGRLAADGTAWVSGASLQQHQFADADDFEAVAKSIERCRAYATGDAPGPFARLGWFSELQAWAGEVAARAGFELKGKFAQLNASPTFSLVRLDTNGPAVWFKAVGEPNLREYPVTLALSKAFPAFVPYVLSAREDWNAWLSLEADGVHPDANSSADVWVAIATNLAELQIASVGQGLHLLDAGCRDARVSSLRECLPPFLEVVAELMDQQMVASPARLSLPQLQELRAQLDDLLETFTRFHLPTTLGHLDFNPSNIVIHGRRCVFLDWAEPCCGPSFLTLHYLLEHVSHIAGGDPSLPSRIASAYIGTWSDFIDPSVAWTAFDISRPLAVLAYAACATGWRDDRRRQTETPYLRSLARRLKRECDELRGGGVCSPRTAAMALGSAKS